jgi:7-carboxy-7-deazaguanine synthase
LIGRLCNENYEVLIETGGYVSTEAVDPRAKIILDIKCPASGEAERNDWSNLERLRAQLDEVKFVVADRADWDFATRIIAQYELERRAKAILISPAWGMIDLQELAKWIGESDMRVRMQLQLHKYIWGPDVHGV